LDANAILGKIFVLGSSSPGTGLSYFQVQTTSLFLFARRLAVCMAGSLITSMVNGHWKKFQTIETTASAAAGSARDMLSAAAGAGSPSDAAADPQSSGGSSSQRCS
jgi:hypothetical protein